MNSPVREYHRKPVYLHTFRYQRGLTQAQMAEWLGVSANAVARWERGERKLPPLLSLVMALQEEWESSP